jgi:RNA-splicing ligase RtcB
LNSLRSRRSSKCKKQIKPYLNEVPQGAVPGMHVPAHFYISDSGLAEEAPQAIKDVESVVDAVEAARLSFKAARLRPVAVIKGEWMIRR